MTENKPADARAARRRRKAARDERPVLPQRTSDELDTGWGDEPGGYSDDWYRGERPPHHGD